MPINNTQGFTTRGQADFIKRHGETVHFWHGMKCPCGILQNGSNVPDPNRARPDCQACHGLGWTYVDAGLITGLVTNIVQEKELLMAGIVSMGDLVFSPQIGTNLADYDKVQLTWTEGIPYEGELLIRGTTTTDTTMYGIMGVDPDGCITVDPTTGILNYYVANVDFTYAGNVITWGLTANAPTAGSVYSFKYAALIDWIAFVPPQPRRERGTSLGQKVILKKKHSVFNGV
jgi:hypothetical protein